MVYGDSTYGEAEYGTQSKADVLVEASGTLTEISAADLQSADTATSITNGSFQDSNTSVDRATEKSVSADGSIISIGQATTDSSFQTSSTTESAGIRTSTTATDVNVSDINIQTETSDTAKPKLASSKVIGTSLSDNSFPDNPVAYYPLNNISSGVAKDNSNNDFDGTVIGAEESSDGVSGSNSALFNRSNQDRIDIPDVNITGDVFTLSAWIKTDNASNFHGVLHIGRYTGMFVGPDGGWSIQTNGDNAGATASDTNILDGKFHHLVAIFIGNDSYIGYEDGKKVFNIATSDASGSVGQGAIGERVGASDRFDGIIDEARIYNRALTKEEILQLYENPLNETTVNSLTITTTEDKPVLSGSNAKTNLLSNEVISVVEREKRSIRSNVISALATELAVTKDISTLTESSTLENIKTISTTVSAEDVSIISDLLPFVKKSVDKTNANEDSSLSTASASSNNSSIFTATTDLAKLPNTSISLQIANSTTILTDTSDKSTFTFTSLATEEKIISSDSATTVVSDSTVSDSDTTGVLNNNSISLTSFSGRPLVTENTAVSKLTVKQILLSSTPMSTNEKIIVEDTSTLTFSNSVTDILAGSTISSESPKVSATLTSELETLSTSVTTESIVLNSLSSSISAKLSDTPTITNTTDSSTSLDIISSPTESTSVSSVSSINQRVLPTFPDDPVAYYPLDSVEDGKILDASSNQNDGVSNSSVLSAPGIVENSALFTDDSAEISINYNAGKEVIFSDWTVSGWIKLTDWSSNERKEWLSISEDRTEDKPLDFVHESGEIRHYRGGAAGSVLSHSVSNLSGWHHVSVRQQRNDSSSVSVEIFLDGEEVDSASGNYENMRPSLKFTIGNIVDGRFDWIDYIDEVRLYDRSLTNEEVKTLYTNPVGGSTFVGTQTSTDARVSNQDSIIRDNVVRTTSASQAISSLTDSEYILNGIVTTVKSIDRQSISNSVASDTSTIVSPDSTESSTSEQTASVEDAAQTTAISIESIAVESVSIIDKVIKGNTNVSPTFIQLDSTTFDEAFIIDTQPIISRSIGGISTSSLTASGVRFLSKTNLFSTTENTSIIDTSNKSSAAVNTNISAGTTKLFDSAPRTIVPSDIANAIELSVVKDSPIITSATTRVQNSDSISLAKEISQTSSQRLESMSAITNSVVVSTTSTTKSEIFIEDSSTETNTTGSQPPIILEGTTRPTTEVSTVGDSANISIGQAQTVVPSSASRSIETIQIISEQSGIPLSIADARIDTSSTDEPSSITTRTSITPSVDESIAEDTSVSIGAGTETTSPIDRTFSFDKATISTAESVKKESDTLSEASPLVIDVDAAANTLPIAAQTQSADTSSLSIVQSVPATSVDKNNVIDISNISTTDLDTFDANSISLVEDTAKLQILNGKIFNISSRASQLPDDPLVHYPLETVSTGILKDVSGNELDGIHKSGVKSISGVGGTKGAFYDGSTESVIKDYERLDNLTGFALSIWFKPTDGSKKDQTIIGTAPEFELIFDGPGNRTPNERSVWWAIDNGTGDWSVNSPPMPSLALDTWHHLLLQQSTSDNVVELWVNGEKYESDNGIGIINDSESPLEIGSRGGKSFASFIGGVDEVRIYERELSEEEITSLYETPVSLSKKKELFTSSTEEPIITNGVLLGRRTNELARVNESPTITAGSSTIDISTQSTRSLESIESLSQSTATDTLLSDTDIITSARDESIQTLAISASESSSEKSISTDISAESDVTALSKITDNTTQSINVARLSAATVTSRKPTDASTTIDEPSRATSSVISLSSSESTISAEKSIDTQTIGQSTRSNELSVVGDAAAISASVTSAAQTPSTSSSTESIVLRSVGTGVPTTLAGGVIATTSNEVASLTDSTSVTVDTESRSLTTDDTITTSALANSIQSRQLSVTTDSATITQVGADVFSTDERSTSLEQAVTATTDSTSNRATSLTITSDVARPIAAILTPEPAADSTRSSAVPIISTSAAPVTQSASITNSTEAAEVRVARASTPLSVSPSDDNTQSIDEPSQTVNTSRPIDVLSTSLTTDEGSVISTPALATGSSSTSAADESGEIYGSITNTSSSLSESNTIDRPVTTVANSVQQSSEQITKSTDSSVITEATIPAKQSDERSTTVDESVVSLSAGSAPIAISSAVSVERVEARSFASTITTQIAGSDTLTATTDDSTQTTASTEIQSAEGRTLTVEKSSTTLSQTVPIIAENVTRSFTNGSAFPVVGFTRNSIERASTTDASGSPDASSILSPATDTTTSDAIGSRVDRQSGVVTSVDTTASLDEPAATPSAIDERVSLENTLSVEQPIVTETSATIRLSDEISQTIDKALLSTSAGPATIGTSLSTTVETLEQRVEAATISVSLTDLVESTSATEEAISTRQESVTVVSDEFTESFDTAVDSTTAVSGFTTDESTSALDIGRRSLGTPFSEAGTSLSEAVSDGNIYIAGPVIFIVTDDDTFFITSSVSDGTAGITLSEAQTTVMTDSVSYTLSADESTTDAVIGSYTTDVKIE